MSGTTIIEAEGGFKLCGPDGYSTSEQTYLSRAEAEAARAADDAAELSVENPHAKPSPVSWIY